MTTETFSTEKMLRQEDIGFQSNLYNDPNPTRRWLHNNRRSWVVNALNAHTPTGSENVLEIGVGCGIFTHHLVRRGCEIMAVDINADFLNAVSGLPGVTVCQCDATAGMAFTDYDVALCSEVLEHVPPERSAKLLQGIHNSLKPGGILVLTTPQAFSTMEMAARLLRFRPIIALARLFYGQVDELGHINLLTSGALKRQIAKAGFEIAEETRRGLYLPLIAEIGGTLGQRVAAMAEALLRNAPVFSGLLWTQGYVLRKPT